MKAVLVIDMPNNCEGCSFETESLNCGKPMCCTARRKRIEDESAKPSWCPLKPLPEEFPSPRTLVSPERNKTYFEGWNDCIEEITGETE